MLTFIVMVRVRVMSDKKVSFIKEMLRKNRSVGVGDRVGVRILNQD
jgi:hypothetical protein